MIKNREEYQSYYDSHSNSSNAHLTTQFGRLMWLLTFIRGRVCEVGSQMGGVTKIIASLPSVEEVVAIDITDRHIEKTTKTISESNIKDVLVDVRKCYIEDMDEEEKFDTIINFEVLEHVLDDKEVLGKCARMLEPNGSILISVPYENNFPEEDHLRTYTVDNMNELLTNLRHIYGGMAWVNIVCEPQPLWIIARYSKEDWIPWEYGKVPEAYKKG